MNLKSKKQDEPEEVTANIKDVLIIEAKKEIHDASWEAVASGRLRQDELFLISPSRARRATVKLKA